MRTEQEMTNAQKDAMTQMTKRAKRQTKGRTETKQNQEEGKCTAEKRRKERKRKGKTQPKLIRNFHLNIVFRGRAQSNSAKLKFPDLENSNPRTWKVLQKVFIFAVCSQGPSISKSDVCSRSH
jgi:hypothetical protein